MKQYETSAKKSIKHTIYGLYRGKIDKQLGNIKASLKTQLSVSFESYGDSQI